MKYKSVIIFGMKAGFGAYIGWNVATGMDRGIARVLNNHGFSEWSERVLTNRKKKS